MEKPNYYAIITAEVRYDKRLKPNAKLLYAELTALANAGGFSWASNSYFADLYDVSKETVSRWISQLAKFGYIRVEVVRNERGEIDKRKIFINQIPQPQQQQPEPPKQPEQVETMPPKVQESPVSDQTAGACKEIIDYLNSQAGTKYRANTPKTKALIQARFKEGFGIDEFKVVIFKMCNEWRNDPKMAAYLRPETLFGPKFEGYLNRKEKPLTTANMAAGANFSGFMNDLF